MEKYKFAYIVEVTVELPTDDKELVRQVENENGVKVTYKNLEAELTDMIAEHMEDFGSHFDINVQPVKHGRWIDTEPEYNYERHCSAHYQCSECGRRTGIRQTRTYKFCPNCGARMDGEYPK